VQQRRAEKKEKTMNRKISEIFNSTIDKLTATSTQFNKYFMSFYSRFFKPNPNQIAERV